MKLTREEAKEMLPIIQAWADGKTVDWYDEDIGWRASRFELDFDKNPKYFRIKSEPESKPKYRPFKSQEECFDEMMKHQPFGWFKSVHNKNLFNIVGINDDGIKITNTLTKYMDTYSDAFSNIEFVDGTPFGIKDV